MAEKRVSVVVPFFNEARSLATLTERVQRVLEAEGFDWEIIFVDDGSVDDSYAEVEKLHATEPRVKSIRFAKNFGSHIAISAGLEHASGDLAIVMTADLEEPPEAIPDFLAKWREGLHVVWGIRAARVNRGLSAVASRLYHRLFAWVSEQGPGQSEIGGGFFLVDGRVLSAMRRFRERNRNIIGLLLWAGFKQGRLTYKPEPRKFGKSKWSFAKKIRLAIDTLVGFSTRPIRLLLGGGTFSIALGIAALVYAIIADNVFAAIACAAAIVLGVQLIATWLLGEYVSRALDEGRGRPLYVVMDALGLERLDSRP